MSPVWSALAMAAPVGAPKSEKDLILPLFEKVTFFGVNGWSLLSGGLVVCALGLIFGLVVFAQLKKLPVHQAMRDISELIYETCKTYLQTQGKFIGILWAFIATIMVIYFGVFEKLAAAKVITIVIFSVVGIA